jgi:hypothetical protein
MAPATTPRFDFTRYDGRRGIAWLVESYRMFRQHRLRWIGLLLGYYVALWVVQHVPFLGVFIAPLLKPVFAVGFLAAAWTQERGGKPTMRMLVRGFEANVLRLLPLGVVFVAGVSLALGSTALVDGGRLLEMLFSAPASAENDPTATAREVRDTLGSARVQFAMMFGALCALPTILALWWAPALVVFQDATPLAALGASLRAAVANWRAALRYGVAMFVMGGIVPTLVSTMIAILVPPPQNEMLAALIVLPYIAFFVATLHISDYVSYRDVFHAGETLAPIAQAQASADSST